MEKKAYPIWLLCQVMQVSRSGFYSWKKRGESARVKEREELIPQIREIHQKARGTYGSRRMAKAIESSTGCHCGRYKAATLMKLAGVEVRQKKKFKATTDSKHNLPVAPNTLNRDFSVDRPNRVWVGDITYIWTLAGWLYLAVVIDLYSRMVVGWSVGRNMTKQLVIDAFLMAIWRRKPAPNLLFHSDRGSQYCSLAFQNLLEEYQIDSSMSRKGNCWDNAVAESFFGSLKNELIHGMRYTTRDQAKGDIVDYIEMFYNSRRLHSHLNYVSPADWERMTDLQKAA